MTKQAVDKTGTGRTSNGLDKIRSGYDSGEGRQRESIDIGTKEGGK